MPAEQNQPVHEVVLSRFCDLEAAVDDLPSAGFDRAELSVHASAPMVEKTAMSVG